MGEGKHYGKIIRGKYYGRKKIMGGPKYYVREIMGGNYFSKKNYGKKILWQKTIL